MGGGLQRSSLNLHYCFLESLSFLLVKCLHQLNNIRDIQMTNTLQNIRTNRVNLNQADKDILRDALHGSKVAVLNTLEKMEAKEGGNAPAIKMLLRGRIKTLAKLNEKLGLV